MQTGGTIIIAILAYLFIKTHNIFPLRDDLIKENLNDTIISAMDDLNFGYGHDTFFYYYTNTINIAFDSIIILDNFAQIHTINTIINLYLEQPLELNFLNGVLLPGTIASIPVPVLQEPNMTLFIDLTIYFTIFFIIMQF